MSKIRLFFNKIIFLYVQNKNITGQTTNKNVNISCQAIYKNVYNRTSFTKISSKQNNNQGAPN